MSMSNIEDSEGEVVEYGFTTHVRGRKFRVTSALLNRILKISHPPPTPHISYPPTTAFAVLRPGEPFPPDQELHLTFKPTTMPPLHRVIWYIVCRNLLQKGGSYTHFAQEDYKVLAAVIDKVSFNIGDWLYAQMIKFRFNCRQSSHVPFASLISVILYYHKIWHLDSLQDNIVKIPAFGKTQLNLMKISFEEGSAQSRAKSKASQGTSIPGPSSQAPTEEEEEVRSRPISSRPSRIPHDFEIKVKEIVQKALSALTETLDSEFSKLTASFNQTQQEILDTTSDLTCSVGTLIAVAGSHTDQLQNLTTKVDQLIKQSSTSAFGSEFGASEGPNFTPPSPTFPSPSFTPQAEGSSAQTPSTELLPTAEQLRTPAGPLVLYNPPTPATEILPTAEQLQSPALPLVLYSPLALPGLPTFEDDKGGEEDKN